MLALLAFEVTVYRHQKYYRVRNKLSPPASRIIFHDITRQHLDNGIISCIKYFINYFFYKFGLEVEQNKIFLFQKNPKNFICCLFLVNSPHAFPPADLPTVRGQCDWPAYGFLRNASRLRLDCSYV